MFAKTFCEPGSYIEVAPIGLQAMLEYNRNGLLQKVKLLEPTELGVGFVKEVKNDVLGEIYKIVPTTINLKDGTTWVEGTFFTKTLPQKHHGKIAWDCEEDFLDMLRRGEDFQFYAGNVRSLAASFKGALTIRNWLMSNGFKVLPGIVVPVEMKQETLDMLFRTSNAGFNPNFVAAFYIFGGINEARFKTSELYYNKVEKCDMELSPDGFVKGRLKLDSGEELVISYADACANFCNYAPHVSVLYEKDETGNAHIVKGVTENALVRTPIYVCPVCHARVMLPASGPCQCHDPNCLSRLYPDSCKMLRKLSLPELTYEQYKELVDNKDIICLTDILSLDMYKELRPTVTIAEALSSIVPMDVVRDSMFFEKLANSCNNIIDSVFYYLKNPNRIRTELNVNSPDCVSFVKWISDPYNLTSVSTIFSCVEIKERSKKFEGAPIFRSNSFVLTGKFKRGSYKDVASMLESYDAKIYPDIESDNIPDAVVVGGTNENISGHIIKVAKSFNIPLVDEDKFFKMYGIDADIVANLL